MKKFTLISIFLFVTSNSLAEGVFPKIHNYWLQAAPPNAKVMAAYGELINNSNKDIILVDAYSPAFNMTMIHQTKIVDGVAKMIHQDELVIKPDDKLLFKPGGFHIMLMQPKFKISKGDKIKVNLIYRILGKKQIQETWFPVEFR